MRASHLTTKQEMYFDKDTTPEWAVAYAWCEENNRMSWLFSMAQDLKLAEAYAQLPMEYGKLTVACGDWIAFKEDQSAKND